MAKREKHRAVKGRPARPLDKPQPNNHAVRHESKKAEATLAQARLEASAALCAEQ
jgi:hypothetical protein